MNESPALRSCYPWGYLHLTGFDGVQHTHLVKRSNKVSNKVVTVVCRLLKIDAVAVLVERNRSDEMVEIGNINAYKDFHGFEPPFHKI